MNEDDCCEMCGVQLDDEDFKGACECRGKPYKEFVIYGYKCRNCGHEKRF